jgi:hypothetical protein
MKSRIALGILVVIAASTPIAHAEEVRARDFAVKTRCASGDVRVTLADGVVKRSEVSVFWCGLPGRPGYRCDAWRGRTEMVRGGLADREHRSPSFQPRLTG